MEKCSGMEGTNPLHFAVPTALTVLTVLTALAPPSQSSRPGRWRRPLRWRWLSSCVSLALLRQHKCNFFHPNRMKSPVGRSVLCWSVCLRRLVGAGRQWPQELAKGWERGILVARGRAPPTRWWSVAVCRSKHKGVLLTSKRCVVASGTWLAWWASRGWGQSSRRPQSHALRAIWVRTPINSINVGRVANLTSRDTPPELAGWIEQNGSIGATH